MRAPIGEGVGYAWFANRGIGRPVAESLGRPWAAHPRVSWDIPQQQLSDTAPADLQERLLALAGSLPGVSVAESRISVPGAQALTLDEPGGEDDAFLVPSVAEFAHLHPSHDGSLHLALPADLAADRVTRGWGRMHPWAGTRSPPAS